jgi:hypothetical protein
MRKTEMKLRSMLLLCVASSLACTPAMAVTAEPLATDAGVGAPIESQMWMSWRHQGHWATIRV